MFVCFTGGAGAYKLFFVRIVPNFAVNYTLSSATGGGFGNGVALPFVVTPVIRRFLDFVNVPNNFNIKK